MPPDDQTSEDDQQRRAALLADVKRRLKARLAGPAPGAKPLFRVVEVTRDPRGRLSTLGQIWHTDLAHVRRFGHALGANSTAQRVEITDRHGAVVEQIPVCSSPAQAAGWAGWRERPLPPLPSQPQPPPRLQRRPAPPPPFPPASEPAPSAAAPPAPRATAARPSPRPVQDFPVVNQVGFDPEATAPLSPAPPP